jgi:glutathione S-transferase
MYAPVVLRFRIYQLEADAVAQEYMNTALDHPAMVEWIEAGKAETEGIPTFED